MKKNYDEKNEEIEIDLLELFLELKKRWWLLLAAFLLGFCLTGAYSRFLLTPQYTSEAKLYVLSKETTLTSLADLQIGSQLTEDYKIMITSRPVLQDVISRLGLDMDYKSLRSRLVIGNPDKTRILEISIMDPDPKLAREIVDEVASTASDYIGEIMEMVPPKLIEGGEVAVKKTSPSNGKNALMGGLICLFLVGGVVTMKVVMNDSVKTEDDVKRYLDLPVLAVIPKKEDRQGRRTRKGRRYGPYGRYVPSGKSGTLEKPASSGKTGTLEKPASSGKFGTLEKPASSGKSRRREETGRQKKTGGDGNGQDK